MYANYTSAYQNIETFEAAKEVDQLLLLMQKRLVIMHEVARTKWNQRLPIEDKLREQQILEELAKKAKQDSLNEKWLTAFFQAQMDASKEMQKRDFAMWQKEEVLELEQVFSLKEGLRSCIDELNQEIMILLSKFYKNLDVNSRLVLDHPISIRKPDYIENDIWLLAIFPLKNFDEI